MSLEEAKEEFLKAWGALGSSWGINRTMAQIHALLLISPKPMSTDEVMEKLNISGGNANMNLRELIAWGLVYKELKPGDRKEYFSANKNMWEVAQAIVRERKRRELDPIRKVIDSLSKVSTLKKGEEYQSFMQMIKGIQEVSENAEKVSDAFVKTEKTWFMKKLIRIFT